MGLHFRLKTISRIHLGGSRQQRKAEREKVGWKENLNSILLSENDVWRNLDRLLCFSMFSCGFSIWRSPVARCAQTSL